MNADRYLLTKRIKMSNGLTEIKEERLIWMPQEPALFEKHLERHREDLKQGEWFTFHKVIVGKRYYQVEAAA